MSALAPPRRPKAARPRRRDTLRAVRTGDRQTSSADMTQPIGRPCSRSSRGWAFRGRRCAFKVSSAHSCPFAKSCSAMDECGTRPDARCMTRALPPCAQAKVDTPGFCRPGRGEESLRGAKGRVAREAGVECSQRMAPLVSMTPPRSPGAVVHSQSSRCLGHVRRDRLFRGDWKTIGHPGALVTTRSTPHNTRLQQVNKAWGPKCAGGAGHEAAASVSFAGAVALSIETGLKLKKSC